VTPRNTGSAVTPALRSLMSLTSLHAEHRPDPLTMVGAPKSAAIPTMAPTTHPQETLPNRRGNGEADDDEGRDGCSDGLGEG